jgi:4-amino-4-deoxy-L-arabinose transferase-like glycosyltransferase
VLPLLVIGSYCMLAEGWAELGRVMSGGSLGDRWRWIVKRNRWFFNWKTPAAIAIGGLLYYIPFAVSHVETGTTTGIFMVYRENVKRFFEPFDHRGPVYLYTYVIFALMAPWSALLPAALVNAHGRRHPDPDDARSDRFTMVFFWATFVFFTLSGSRRSYYLLPILPAAAILIARLLERTFEQMTPATRMLTKIGFGVIAGAAILSAVAFVPPRMVLPEPYSKLPPVPDLGIFAMFWIGSIGAIFYAMRDFSTRRILVACGAIAWLFMFYLYVFAMPAGDAYRGEEAFAAQTRAIIGNDEAGLALFRNQGPVYYLGLPRPIPEYSRLGELNDAVSDHKVQWLIVRRRDLPLLKFKSALVAAEATYPWDSEQHHLNSMVLLHIAPPQ